ncbi:MAG: serine hydrolase domain-containing protein [Steroidobacterales bacterium]
MTANPHPSDPAPQAGIRFEDDRFLEFPAIRWSLSHLRDLTRTATVVRGSGACSDLGVADAATQASLDEMTFKDLDGRTRCWSESLADTYTDGILVLHRGRCVYQKYFGALAPDRLHACFSITKSYVATLAATLVHEGVLDEQKAIDHYLPELAASAFADASLRQVMDMQVGIAYSEIYADPDTDFWTYARAGGLRPFPADYRGPRSIHDYLATLRKDGDHGQVFAYKTVNTDVLAWVMTRVAGESLSAMLSTRIWSRIGCEQDACIGIDATGVEMAGAGLSACLRDLARFGELMRRDGAWGSSQVIPAAVVADIRRGADPARFAPAGYTFLPGYSYRNMWWVSHNELGAYEGRGIHGQRLYIAPRAEVVIARFASHPVAASAANDGITMPAFLALSRLLK